MKVVCILNHHVRPQGVTEVGAAGEEVATAAAVEVGYLTTSRTSLFKLDALDINFTLFRL